MIFLVPILAFLFFGWVAPDAARAMIPRDAPASVIATRYSPSETADGTLVAEYDYDPYGRLIRETGPQAATCPFRYSTKWYDPDLGLLYYGHRWYDAASLKWLTPDPIGERGGANLTAFCDGDPINRVDPLGLFTPEGMYEEFLTKYGDKGLKLLRFLAAEGWNIEGRDFWWSRTSFDEQAKVLALELDWSDKKAADKLFKALSSRYDKGFGRFLRGAGSVYGASIVAAQEMGLEGYENAWTGIEAELGRIGSQAQPEIENEAKFALLTVVGLKSADLAIDAIRARRLACSVRTAEELVALVNQKYSPATLDAVITRTADEFAAVAGRNAQGVLKAFQLPGGRISYRIYVNPEFATRPTVLHEYVEFLLKTKHPTKLQAMPLLEKEIYIEKLMLRMRNILQLSNAEALDITRQINSYMGSGL